MQRIATPFSIVALRLVAALCLIVALYALARRGGALFGDAKSFALYLAAPVFLATLFLAACRLTAETRSVILMTFASAGAAVYAAEVYLEYFDRPSAAKIGAASPVKQDRRKGIEVLLDLRRQGIDAYISLPLRGQQLVPSADGLLRTALSGTDLTPLGGISGKYTLFCNEGGEWRSFDADEHGFNNPSGLWNGAEPIDIAAIGDSFTMGVCVPPEHHSTGIIRAQYPRMLNLGRNGTGPLFQYAALREYLVDVKPKIVLWFFIEDNDIFGDMRAELLIPALRRYLTDGYRQGLRTRQAEIDGALVRRIEELIHLWQTARDVRPRVPVPAITWAQAVSIAKLTHVRGMLGLAVDPAFEEETRALFRQYSELLRLGRETVESWNGRLVLVYLPAAQRFSGLRFAQAARTHQREIAAAAAAAGVSMIDVVPPFEAYADPSSLYQGHYTPEGYGIVGNTVLAELRRLGYAPATTSK